LSSFNDPKGVKAVHVNIRLVDDIFKLYHHKSSKYAGLLMRPSLARLLRDYEVKLEGKLTLSDSAKTGSQGPRSKVKDVSKINSERPLHITIYGKMDDATEIGNILSDDGLFLQHPPAQECGPQFTYHNPHYFVPPGSTMPKLEDLSLYPGDKAEGPSDPLDEVSRARFTRIFDAACDLSSDVPAIEPSARLNRALKA
jgi:hypothetical protein